MSARSRVAFASGVGGLIGAGLLLSGRFDGSVALVLLLAAAARIAVAASLVDSPSAVAVGAHSSIVRHAAFAPAWALVVATAVVRSGSTLLSDARGANAVAGLAIARGETATVIGVWFALAAGIIALADRTGIAIEVGPDERRRAAVLSSLDRLEIAAVVAQAALLVSLFAGPQVTSGIDAVPWVVGIAGLTGVAWFARNVDVPKAPLLAVALSAIGLGLAIAGGAP